MTSLTINNNRSTRKTLSSQIDRLDATLDGLAENLNEAIALAVKDVVGEVVREAVEAAVKEVLANPELLRAALAQQNPTAREAQPEPQRRSVREGLQRCWEWVSHKTVEKASQVKKRMGLAWSWCLAKLKKIGAQTAEHMKGIASQCVNLGGVLRSLGQFLWRWRMPLLLSLAVGTGVGLSCSWAGPVISSAVSGVAGYSVSLVGMARKVFWDMARSDS